MPALRTKRHSVEASTAPVNGVPAALPRAPAVVPPGRRRRPRWALAGLAVLVLGGLLGSTLYSAAGDRVSVIGIAAPVAFGEQLQASDLVEVGVVADPLLQPVPYTDLDAVVGMTAATDLVPGSLLTRSALADELVPGVGQELVPIALQTSRLPASGLWPRDEVLLVATAGADGQAAAPAGEDAVPGRGVDSAAGTVLRVGTATSGGLVVVDVLVDSGDGAELAALAADGRIALVVLPRNG